MNSLQKYAIPNHRWTGIIDMTNMVRECFSEAISALIKQRGITQKELAVAMGLTQTSVSRWVNGKEIPSHPTLDALCRYFNVPPMALFAATENMYAAGPGKIVLDLEKIAAESGYIITKKDS